MAKRKKSKGVILGLLILIIICIVGIGILGFIIGTKIMGQREDSDNILEKSKVQLEEKKETPIQKEPISVVKREKVDEATLIKRFEKEFNIQQPYTKVTVTHTEDYLPKEKVLFIEWANNQDENMLKGVYCLEDGYVLYYYDTKAMAETSGNGEESSLREKAFEVAKAFIKEHAPL